MHEDYSTGLRIKGQTMARGSAGPLNSKDATQFIQGTKACLDALKSTSTGARLIKEINESGHRISIYRAKEITGGNYQAGDSAASGVDMVKDLSARHSTDKTELGHVIKLVTQDLSKRNAFQKLFRIGKARPRFLKRDAIARLVGVSSKDLKDMEAGKKSIDKRTDYKLRAYLYDFLTPGTGEACHVVFNHVRDNLSKQHERYLPHTVTWKKRPPAIALGHELIHAWRIVTGMVLYPYGWEEEAMTVGLPPFSNMPLTENRIRVDWGNLAVRPDYQSRKWSPLLVSKEQLGLGDRLAWQGNRDNLRADKEVHSAMKDRRSAMGYDDDEDEDVDDWDIGDFD